MLSLHLYFPFLTSIDPLFALAEQATFSVKYAYMSPRKVLIILGLLCLCFGGIATKLPAFQVRADIIDDLEKQKNDLQHLLDLSAAATTPLESTVTDLQNRMNKAQADIHTAQVQTDQIAQTITVQEKDIARQYQIFAFRVAAEYKRKSLNSPFLILLASQNAANLTRDLAYRLAAENQNNSLIHQTGAQIQDLQQQKADLVARQQKLSQLRAEMDKQVAQFQTIIQGAKAYQKSLAGRIADLSAQQTQILAARSGSFVTSVGDVPLADDFNASIAFKPQAPSDSFAVFSFGAFTHRNGMSQYGAKGRADSGQSVETILQAYYPGATLKKDYNEPGNITVDGYGSISFEGRYLKGIGEMPSSWNSNALKAQAVAARSYALSYTNNGQKSICTNENCQVFTGQNKGGAWESAVNDTNHWVLVDGGGNPISTQYASTDGGYTNSVGWDTASGNNSGDWSSQAWESKAGSPWFYKAWYTQGYSVNSNKCGRNHPWLSQQEMSDIVNAWIVRKNPNGADVNRIQPVSISQCNVGGGGGNPYSMEELKSFADNSGGAVTHINSVSVSNNNSAQTSSVHFDTNRGSVDIPGDEFKTTFNIRAPGYLSIPQTSYTFFNIEHKS